MGSQPPRLVTRALVASFLTVAMVLTAVFLLFSLNVRMRTRESVMANLETSQQVFAGIEARRQKELAAALSTLAENPTLKAALDTWQTEKRSGGAERGLLATVENELAKLAALVHAEVLAVVDTKGEVVVRAGPRAAAWPKGQALIRPVADASATPPAPIDTVAVVPAGVFRVRGAPLVLTDVIIGSLVFGTPLDAEYARDLASLARADSAIVMDGKVQATTLPAETAAQLAAAVAPGRGREREIDASVTLGRESWVVRRVGGVGAATFLALASIDAEAKDATWTALKGVAWIGLVALALAAFGSWWLARALTLPIDRLSRALAKMTEARRFDAPVPATGSSRELDALTETFNALIQSLAQAEAETQAAYLGAIRALAAALDARDPYTSGHSERVSAVSVEMGRAMNLPDHDVSTLRLGALLHDIGKIGVPDEVLRKPAALTASEFELIRAHPVVGARILRSIPFLVAHLPIVELHHERPDGRGYPYGLVGDAIPLAARIVHVADAFDAMTSARAYRPGRLPHEAIAELQRNIGTDFDRDAVEALVTALPRLPAAFAAFDATAFQIAAFQRSQAS
jgi:putative nucleotidyltransferase with HDIG domain